MIKKLLLLSALFFALQQSKINAQSYTFSHTTSTYTDLTSPIVVSSPFWDDYNIYSTILPFQFQLYGQSFDTIYFYSDFASFTYDFSQWAIGYYMYAGITDNSTSTATISFETTGSAPNRIFKLQIKDAGFYDNVPWTDYTNYQLWLYESTNVIEMHYGPNSVLDPLSWQVPGATGPGIAVVVGSNVGLTLIGPASNPVVDPTSNINTVAGAPANGMVYQFAPATTGINKVISKPTFSIYPNPSNGNITIHSKDLSFDGDLNVYDVSGKRVYHNFVSFVNSATFNLSFAPGIYTAELNDGKTIQKTKLVIE